MDASERTTYDPWLHRFAVLTAIITFFLLGLGGLVTSHETGMSVPDWPNSYGYNMFFFPIKDWVGGIFYEHTHRLLASGVGLLTTILAVWLWRKDPRQWMKWLGVIAFVLVVVQGILGGMRVVLSDAQLGIIHGVVGQSFFILTCALALFTGRFWQKMENIQQPTSNNQQPMAGSHSSAEALNIGCPPALRRLVLFATILIFCQLILGATMRGQHAGLAIPDFPTAYGKIWPDTSPAALAHYNADRMDVLAENPITRFQILLQMAHRLVALAIFALVAASAWQAWRRLGGKDPLTKFAFFWLALIVCQIALGAWTIWSNKAADVATLHLMGGALSLATGALWCLIAFGRQTKGAKIAPATRISGAFGAPPAMAGSK
jgi:heme a synthase